MVLLRNNQGKSISRNKLNSFVILPQYFLALTGIYGDEHEL